ncbi:hypothetical protein HJO_02450 [Hyphomonas johnsonii MHS-2]|uniref:Uncharacterized protein n=1 Tax=Hyphomonas johnsonii MHS-2 TaxID=1280950 RepID=A0A059FUT0_9PROT|nr:hypothetical protein HJO_02450 [Hyphomonas johnsonii MHS-2]
MRGRALRAERGIATPILSHQPHSRGLLSARPFLSRNRMRPAAVRTFVLVVIEMHAACLMAVPAGRLALVRDRLTLLQNWRKR